MIDEDKNLFPAAIKENNSSPSSPSSIIGPGFIIEGIFKGNGNLAVFGLIHGDIHLGENNISVEKEGKVKGDIRARHILIKGLVKGNLFATGRVIIESGATLTGNITALSVSIREDAQFKGRVKMAP
ncbi:MAG: bactofilin family protein [Acidobacteriota bacterium]